MKRNVEIIFYAPLGKGICQEKIGGAEAGCLKTIGIYKKAGFIVYNVEKAVFKGNLISYFFSIMYTYLKLVFFCLIHPKAIVHIVGFYDKVIRIEWLLMKTARFLHHKVVYEMRNGGLVRIYKQSNASYQRFQRDLWEQSDGLLCQGEEFVSFIKKVSNVSAFYYPNYIQDNFLYPYKLDRKFDKELNLVFFGRLVPSKNINIIIESAAIVKKIYPQTKLHLIGGISEEYLQEMKMLISKCALGDNSVFFYGRKNFEFIVDILHRSHFFLFPSSERNEGHSNSLTEAMGCGVVPIVSKAGFNESICGDPALVVDKINAKLFADVILNILGNHLWELKSQQQYNRIMSNFTESIVGKRLITYIKSINNKY